MKDLDTMILTNFISDFVKTPEGSRSDNACTTNLIFIFVFSPPISGPLCDGKKGCHFNFMK